jgi:Neuraminidase (sialidase)
MEAKWFAKDGSVFSEKVITKKSQDFRLGNTFKCQEVIAFNVGNKVAQYLVSLHNKEIRCE